MITNKIAENATLNRRKCPESAEFLQSGRGKTALKAAGSRQKLNVSTLCETAAQSDRRPQRVENWHV
jgi:hypothetical protein